MRRNKEQFTGHYLGERCQPSSARGRRPNNRICVPCRRTYPGNDQAGVPDRNYSSVCSDCGGELVEISCRLRVPRRSRHRAWKKFLKRYVPEAGRGAQVAAG